jgi:hypothetical protein
VELHISCTCNPHASAPQPLVNPTLPLLAPLSMLNCPFNLTSLHMNLPSHTPAPTLLVFTAND